MQIKVREATSNDQFGPSTGIMNEIANATFNERLFREVVSILRKRLNDHGKNWRHVYKSLIILDYCVQFGSERMIDYAIRNIQAIKTLKEFQYVDEAGRDHGTAVRQKSKELTTLLFDLAKVEEHRLNARDNQERWNLSQDNSGCNSDSSRNGSSASVRSGRSLPNVPHPHPPPPQNINGNWNEEEALQLALQQSQVSSAAANSNQLIDLLSEEPDALSFSSAPSSQVLFPHSQPHQSRSDVAGSADLSSSWGNPANASSFDFSTKNAHIKGLYGGGRQSQMVLGCDAPPVTHSFYPANISPGAGYYDESFVSGAPVNPFEDAAPAAPQHLNPFADASDALNPSNPFAASSVPQPHEQHLVDLEPSSLVTNPYRSAQSSASNLFGGSDGATSLNPFMSAAEASREQQPPFSTSNPSAAPGGRGQRERSLFELQQLSNGFSSQK